MPKFSGTSNTTPAQCEAIIKLANSCLPQGEIAKAFNCSTRTIQCILKNYAEHGHVNDAPRSGRPRKINDCGLHYLQHSLDGDRRQTLGDIT